MLMLVNVLYQFFWSLLKHAYVYTYTSPKIKYSIIILENNFYFPVKIVKLIRTFCTLREGWKSISFQNISTKIFFCSYLFKILY